MIMYVIYKTFQTLIYVQKLMEEFFKNLQGKYILKIAKLKRLYEILSRLYKISLCNFGDSL